MDDAIVGAAGERPRRRAGATGTEEAPNGVAAAHDARVQKLLVVVLEDPMAPHEPRDPPRAVEGDERCHAFLAIPVDCKSNTPAVVALHGTYEEGLWQAAALVEGAKGEPKGEGNKGYLDHMARRGYIVIAPEHFNSCFREPAEGTYETAAFHRKHPEWTAVGKFTYEHSIAVDVLLSDHVKSVQHGAEVDPAQIGVMGHSLGGYGRCM